MHLSLRDKKVIFFDMGNTLLDFHQVMSDDEKDQLGLEEMSMYLKTIKLDISVNALRQQFLLPFYGLFPIRIRDLKELDVYKHLSFLGPLTKKNHNQLLRCFYSAYMKHVVIHDGALSLLKYLFIENKKIAIISNCFLPEFLYREVFMDKGLDCYISQYVFSYTYGIRKPNPELFKIALSQMSIEAADAIMIGDGFRPDIVGSSKVSIESIWYNPHNRLALTDRPRSMVLSITNFEELMKD